MLNKAVEPFVMQRLGVIMEPQPDNPLEVEGVLNPACARGADGQLYLFPRLVGKGNYSRIGIARVRFNRGGDPIGVERLGVALEPQADYELRPDGGGGCEDPRITFVQPLRQYMMTYTAFSPHGPRIALASSDDLFVWRRLGLAQFISFQDIDVNEVDNKDASLFPEAILNRSGKRTVTMLHRPLFRGTHPHQTARESVPRKVDLPTESIWISHCRAGGNKSLCMFVSHRRLAAPVEPWERLKIGGGTPPLRTRHGWLVVYHGVGEALSSTPTARRLRYSAGILVLDESNPCIIRYRSEHPVLQPEVAAEHDGMVADVVFPTGADQRLDLDQPDRIDVYYGMADSRIGVARMQVPAHLPAGRAEKHQEEV